MTQRLYSYQGKASGWEVKDPRLSLTVLFPKWERWTHACTHTPQEIIDGLKARIAGLETERDNHSPDGPYNADFRPHGRSPQQ